MATYDDEPAWLTEIAEKIDLGLVCGARVVVFLGDHEGAVKRGRRRWHPGRSVGLVLAAHPLHDRGWLILVNGHTIIAFEDELALADPQEK